MGLEINFLSLCPVVFVSWPFLKILYPFCGFLLPQIGTLRTVVNMAYNFGGIGWHGSNIAQPHHDFCTI